MKPLKLFFTSLVIFAVIGVGLGFKARTTLQTRIWTSTIINQCKLVNNKTTTATTTSPGQQQVFYTFQGPDEPTVPTDCDMKTFTKTTAALSRLN